MRRVLFRPAARADLAGIWRYTAGQWSPGQADLYTNDIMRTIEALAAGSQKGRAIDEIREGCFKQTVGRHVVVYRLDDADAIEVLRILHPRMDLPTHLP